MSLTRRDFMAAISAALAAGAEYAIAAQTTRPDGRFLRNMPLGRFDGKPSPPTGTLLARHRACLARQAARFLRCSERAAAGALWWLGHGEQLLRGSGVPRTVRVCAGSGDAAMARRFDHYISETTRCLGQSDRRIK